MSAPTSPHGGSFGRATAPGGSRRPVGPAARATSPGTYGRPAGGGRGGTYGSGGEYGGRVPRPGNGGGGRGGGPGGPGRPGGFGGREYRGKPKPKWGRIALVAGAVVLVLALLGVGGAWIYASNLDDDLARTDPFSEITGGRPAKTVDGALNILLIGSDSRDPDAKVNVQSEWRADTIIVMHIPADHSQAYLVSIPRDLYVRVPTGANAGCATGERHKINAAFALGGMPRAVRTVECMTDVRLDHVMAIDFGGFKEVTDALGGVDLKVERTIKSIHKPFRTFSKGDAVHMNGDEALDWIRQRKQFPDGDFARMRHQQEFLKALMDKAASTGTLSNPSKLNNFLKATTSAVTVDEGFSLVDMAVQFRNLRGENLHFITSPHNGSETINGESVVVADREKALALYQAMASDELGAWLTANEPSKAPAN
jgi:LCP family protein required for cell wall assembly